MLQPWKFRLDAQLQTEFNIRNNNIKLEDLSAQISAKFRGGSHIDLSYLCQDCLYEWTESFRVDGQAFIPAQFLPTFLANFSSQFDVQFGVDAWIGIEKQYNQSSVVGRVWGIMQKDAVQTGIWINRSQWSKPVIEAWFKVNGVFSRTRN